VFFLSDKIEFPEVHFADQNGMLAVGGDLTIPRLKLAYESGIFPWYSSGEPILWFSPDPRMVLYPEDLKITKSMKQVLKSHRFRISYNEAFTEVISHCKTIDRSSQGESGTWITNEMKEAYIALHHAGIAKSIEVWEGKELVGGLYGVEVGKVFCGESMFSKVSNASKLALIHLVRENHYSLIDCQVYNPHLASLGAMEINRAKFLARVETVISFCFYKYFRLL
jgi:leucyl/phenylalanyl-tRNA--protein transferase